MLIRNTRITPRTPPLALQPILAAKGSASFSAALDVVSFGGSSPGERNEPGTVASPSEPQEAPPASKINQSPCNPDKSPLTGPYFMEETTLPDLSPLDNKGEVKLERENLEPLWKGFEAAQEATSAPALGKALSRENREVLEQLLHNLREAGFVFHAGVSKEASSARSTEEVLKKLLDGPAELKCKLWVSEGAGPKDRLTQASELKVLAQLSGLTESEPGMQGLRNLAELDGLTFERIAKLGAWTPEWEQIGTLGACQEMAQGKEVRVWGSSPVSHLRIDSLEAAGAADFFHNQGDAATLSRPQLGQAIKERHKEGFQFDVFSQFGTLELDAYRKLLEGADTVELQIEGVSAGDLANPDRDLLRFYKAHLKGYGGFALDFVRGQDDNWTLETRAHIYKALYLGEEQFQDKQDRLGHSQAKNFAQRGYGLILEKNCADPILTAQRWGQLAACYGQADRSTASYVLEHLESLDTKSAGKHFERTLAAAEQGIDFSRATALSDIGELDKQDLALSTIAGLAKAVASLGSPYNRESSDYLMLLKHGPKGLQKEEARELFLEMLKEHGKTGQANEAGAAYRALCAGGSS